MRERERRDEFRRYYQSEENESLAATLLFFLRRSVRRFSFSEGDEKKERTVSLFSLGAFSPLPRPQIFFSPPLWTCIVEFYPCLVRFTVSRRRNEYRERARRCSKKNAAIAHFLFLSFPKKNNNKKQARPSAWPPLP